MSSTTEGTTKIALPVSCIMRGIAIDYYIGTVGTNEDMAIYVRKNATTDYLVTATAEFNVKPVTFTNYNLNIPFSPGDTFQIKMVCPTWATNPLQSRPTFTAYFV